MPSKKPPQSAPTKTEQSDDCPWIDLDANGTGLSVDDFITTTAVRTAYALRRTVTLPYTERFELTMAEWRILSVLAEAGSLTFSELVRLSATDKSLVSRTLRLLEARDLVTLEEINGSYRQGLICKMTTTGDTLYQEAMPVAQKAQATMIRLMTNSERKTLFRLLKKLRHACGEDDISAGEA